jgi:hypothetical protein
VQHRADRSWRSREARDFYGNRVAYQSLSGQTINEQELAPMKTDDDKTNKNPKLEPNSPGNMEKEPEQWVSGDDPMTPAQASYLKTLLEQAGDAKSFDTNLTKAEASRRIDALRKEIGLDDQGKRT